MSRPAVFLDRDGVLNRLVNDPQSAGGESPLTVADVALLPEVGPAIARLRSAGYVLVGVTNQPAAAKGRVSVAALNTVHERVVELLAAQAAALDAWRVCLHHPMGTVPGLAITCSCRKPGPGMLLDAAASLDLDLRRSWIVGDTDADAAAGVSAGCRAVVLTNASSAHKRSARSAHHPTASNLAAATEVVLRAGVE